MASRPRTDPSTAPPSGAVSPVRHSSPALEEALESTDPPQVYPAVRVKPHDPTKPPALYYRRGARAPYAIRWYGISSLYGHFRGFVSRAIAAEQVDSRDWMRPEPPEILLKAVLGTLGGNQEAPTLVEGLKRAFIIDFVADTGDDRDTSYAVGEMLSHAYEVENSDGSVEVLPRGEVLMFGGDVAYPVATADEIHRRLTQPWNEALRLVRTRSTKKRVLLGVPGNHDWYDGLDGFGRLFRKGAHLQGMEREPEVAPEVRAIAKLGGTLRAVGKNRNVGVVLRELHVDEVSGIFRMLGSLGRSLSAMVRGGGKRRRRRLVIHGYTALQEASYFALPIAPNLELWGADRQLGRVDFRQRVFFQKVRKRNPNARLLFLAADPAMAYGEPNEPGAAMLRACKLSFETDPMLYLSGDFHHYERRTFGPSTQIIAGGGGAFLHGTRINESPIGPPAAAFPSQAVSRKLAWGVPLRLVMGRGGYLIHAVGALVATIMLSAMAQGTAAFYSMATIVTLALIVGLYFIAGYERSHPKKSFLVSIPFGLLLGLLPTALAATLPARLPFISDIAPWLNARGIVILANAFASALLYGFFLVTTALLGLEHQQAFTVLGHPGFKHFVRLRVNLDGSVEAFVFGKDDPLVPGPPVLIDRFQWKASRLL